MSEQPVDLMAEKAEEDPTDADEIVFEDYPEPDAEEGA